MTMRQRLSLPFGRPAPVYGEREAMGELVKLIRENITSKYETGFAVRARDCSGRTRVEMLDGTGGADLGLANACEDGIQVGAGGTAEIWWAQRSEGRTVRLLWDMGTRAGRSTVAGENYEATVRLSKISGRVTLATTGAGLYGVTVSDGTRSATTDGSGYYTIRAVPIGGPYTVTPSLTGYTFTPTDRSVTVATTSGSSVDFTAAVVPDAFWVAVGTGTYTVARSEDDGETWAGISDSELPSTPKCVCYGDGTFVVGGRGTNHLSYSTDGGVTWTGLGAVAGSGFTDEIVDVCWNGAAFCAVGTYNAAGTCGIYYSADGTSWTAVNDSDKDGMPDGCGPSRISPFGSGGFACAYDAASYQTIGVSLDNGETWQGYAMQTIADTENDPAWFGDYPVESLYPLASNGTSIVSAGTTPRHDVLTYGSSFVDAATPADWLFVADGIGQLKLLSDSSTQYVGTVGYINDGVHTTAVVIEQYPASSISDLYWDGTQYVALATEWDVGTGLGLIATSATGATWANGMAVADIEGMTGFRRVVKANGRWMICGGGAGEMPIVYSDDLSNWSIGTGGGVTLMTYCYDVAGKDD